MPGTDVMRPTLGVAQRFSECIVVVLLFTVGCAYMLLFRSVVNMEPDEGIVLQGAQRVLEGQVPYRDFFTFYTPGSFYVTALLFKIFGDSIATARSAVVVFGALFPVITYVLARRRCTRRVSLTVAILVAIDAAPYRFLVLHNWDSTLWTCLCAYCAMRWHESSMQAWAFTTGTLAAFTFLVEQSKGAGLFLGLVIGFSILRLCGTRFAGTGAFITGASWPIAVTCVYFASQHALRAMCTSWLWPLRHYSQANSVPYGYQNWSTASRTMIFHTGTPMIRIMKIIAISPGFLVPTLPLIALGLLLHCAFELRRRKNEQCAYYVLLSSIIAGLLLSVVTVRADIIHFVYLAPLFYIVLAWVLGSDDLASRLLHTLRPYLMFYVLLSFGLMGFALLSSALNARTLIETRRGSVRSRENDLLLQYALAHTEPKQKILVYPYLPIYYYLTATESASMYDYFQPGMNTRAQAGEIIESVKANRVSTVLLEPEFSMKIPTAWPRTPAVEVKADTVADYLSRNYKPCHVLPSAAGWTFLYMRSKDSACP